MISSGLEILLRRVANSIGIDIHRHRPEASEAGRLATMLSYHAVDLVLDVGANAGQFAQSIREAGYQSRIVSFEPLSTAHAQLLRASRDDALWEVAPRSAIGDHEGEIEMHISGNSVSSSALAMLDTHAKAAPSSVYVGKERVRLTCLDTIARGYLQAERRPFIKIDTQGYEDQVLDGASELLTRTSGLQLELSFLPLYEGQPLFDGLVERLRSLGFSIWSVWPGFFDPVNGRMLQVDVTFFRD